jgi:hypothetical protein
VALEQILFYIGPRIYSSPVSAVLLQNPPPPKANESRFHCKLFHGYDTEIIRANVLDVRTHFRRKEASVEKINGIISFSLNYMV